MEGTEFYRDGVLDFSSKTAFAASVHRAFDAGDKHFSIAHYFSRSPDTFTLIQFNPGIPMDYPEFNGLHGPGWARVSYPDSFDEQSGRYLALNDSLKELIGRMFMVIEIRSPNHWEFEKNRRTYDRAVKAKFDDLRNQPPVQLRLDL